jgi:hypothetical protein
VKKGKIERDEEEEERGENNIFELFGLTFGKKSKNKSTPGILD